MNLAFLYPFENNSIVILNWHIIIYKNPEANSLKKEAEKVLRKFLKSDIEEYRL